MEENKKEEEEGRRLTDEKIDKTKLYFGRLLGLSGENLKSFETVHIMMMYFFTYGLNLTQALTPEQVKMNLRRQIRSDSTSSLCKSRREAGPAPPSTPTTHLTTPMTSRTSSSLTPPSTSSPCSEVSTKSTTKPASTAWPNAKSKMEPILPSVTLKKPICGSYILPSPFATRSTIFQG
jgi:hypothetical protein